MITGSSATVLANLAYLIGAVVVAVVIGLIVWLRHRKPKSVDANISSFRRGLSALAPEDGGGAHPPPPEPPKIRPVPVGLSHVRLEPVAGGDDESPSPAGDESGGGQTG